MKHLIAIFALLSSAAAVAAQTSGSSTVPARPPVPAQPPLVNSMPPVPSQPPLVNTPPPVPNIPPPNPNTPLPGVNGQVVVQPGNGQFATPGVVNPNLNNPNVQPALNQSVQQAFTSQPLNPTPVPANALNHGYGFGHIPTNGFPPYRTNWPGWRNPNPAYPTNIAMPK